MNHSDQKTVQLKLRQFLKGYRSDNQISAEHAAKKLGIEIATYRNLEGVKPNKRLISSLEFLEKIASLKAWTIHDFFCFLFNNGRTIADTRHAKRALYSWEKDILEIFDQVDISIRESFIYSAKDQKLLNRYLEIISRLNSMSGQPKSLLIDLIHELEGEV